MSQISEKIFNMGWHYPHPGGLDTRDIEAIEELVNKITEPNPIIIDVGCWTGMSSIALALAVKSHNGKVLSFDWCKGSANTGLEDAAKQTDIEELIKTHIRYFDLDNIEFQRLDSATASTKFSNNYADLIFIDADHTYYEVCRDIKLWYPKVKNNGIIAGHDCEFVITETIEDDHFSSWDILKDSPKNPWNNTNSLTFHIGVVRAVSKFFPGAKIENERVWWINKNNPQINHNELKKQTVT